MNQYLDKKLFGVLKVGTLVQWIVAIVLMATISWVYFYPSDVNGDVLRQSDTLQGLANGHESSLYRDAHGGEPTWWTNALFGGMPTFQISPSYNSSPLLSWVGKVYSLGFPQPVSWIFIMMLGFFILLIAMDMKWYLAVLGAIGYGFSSYFFIIIGAGHIWKLLTLAYVPPTLAGVVLAYRGRYLVGAAVAALFGAMQLASNHVQMSYYAAFVVAAMVIAYLAIAIKEKRMAQWCIGTGALLVAAALALAANAPNLYLTKKYAAETMRGGHSELTPLRGENTATATTDGLDKDYITQWSYGKDETATLLIPNVKGGATLKPTRGDNTLLSLADTPKAKKLAESGELDYTTQQVLSQFPQYFGDQPMTNGPVYVGALIAVLALLACVVVAGPMKWALMVVTVLSIFLSWGHNMMWLTDLFIDHFPMYNKFRTVASILVIAELTMPLLAVMALKEMISNKDFMREHRGALLGAFGFGALVCLVSWLAPGIYGSYSASEHEQLIATGQLQQYPAVDAAIRAVRGALVSADAMRSLIVLALGFGVIFYYLKRREREEVSAVAPMLALTLIVLVDMYTVNKRYISEETFVSRFDVPEQAYEPRPADQLIMQDTAMNYRVLDQANLMSPMPSYFHKAVGGYHAAKLTRYNDLLERQIYNNNVGVLNMLNTRYVITSEGQVAQNPEALGNAWWVDSLVVVDNADHEMAALDSLEVSHVAVADKQFAAVLGKATAKQPGDTIFETSYEPNRLTYHSHSAQGGVAVFSEIYFPWGWKVSIDGKPVDMGRVNYVLRALQVPAGDHSIEFRFDPDEVHTTDRLATVAIAGIFLLVANAAIWPFVRRRKPSHDDEKK